MLDQRSDPGRGARPVTASPPAIDDIPHGAARPYLVHPDDGAVLNPRLVEAIELVVRMLERLRAPGPEPERGATPGGRPGGEPRARQAVR